MYPLWRLVLNEAVAAEVDGEEAGEAEIDGQEGGGACVDAGPGDAAGSGGKGSVSVQVLEGA